VGSPRLPSLASIAIALLASTSASAQTTVTNTTLQDDFAEILPGAVLEDQFDASLNTGPGAAVVTLQREAWAYIKGFPGFPGMPSACSESPQGTLRCAFDVEDSISLGPFHESIRDVNYSTIQVAWSSRHGGSLDLKVVIEDEGAELVGSIDVDIEYPVLHFFLIPSLREPDGTIVWSGEVDLDYDGNLLEDALYGTINDAVDEALGDLWKGVAPTVGSTLGFLLNLPPTASHIAITDAQ
jgi:hypothetical protein